MKHACAKFKVFLLDQRGTGLSDAITTSGLLRKGDAPAQAEYLSHFRYPMYFIMYPAFQRAPNDRPYNKSREDYLPHTVLDRSGFRAEAVPGHLWVLHLFHTQGGQYHTGR